MTKELSEVIDYIQDLLDNKTSFDEAWDASFDLPHFISQRSDAIRAEDESILQLLDNEVVELCAALGTGNKEDWPEIITEKTFRKKLAEVLVKLKKL